MNDISVIKFGGSLSKDAAATARFLKDLAALAKRGNVVLVHGGGPEINVWLARLNIETKRVNGLRFTDDATLEVVEMVLSGAVNKRFAARLTRMGAPAVGLSGRDAGFIRCRRVKGLGHVGEPTLVNTKLISALLAKGFLPVVSSIGTDAAGAALNVNADSIAMALAKKLRARRLVLLTDVPGVLDADKRVIPAIRVKDIAGLVRRGVVTGGMIPKLAACAGSVGAGVKEVWIADGARGLQKLSGTVIRK